MQNLNKLDLDKLIAVLPISVQQVLTVHTESFDNLIEIVLDVGREPEARFFNQTKPVTLNTNLIAKEDLRECVSKIGKFGEGSNRAGIEATLHRISAIRNRDKEIVGLTCRVGRGRIGTAAKLIEDELLEGKSILLLGRPGVGKTTVLREVARILAETKRVVIIDTSNEIGGDGDIPHPAIGRARRMQVLRRDLQHEVMIEAVENHTPEVIIIDEIGTELEALAARTIAERGVQLIGTAHGNYLENLIKNPTLINLIGGIKSVTLGDDEARRRGCQKTVLEREADPTFDVAVELREREKWAVHIDLAKSVDSFLRVNPIQPVMRELTLSSEGAIKVTVTNDSHTKLEESNVIPITTAHKHKPLSSINLCTHGIDKIILSKLIEETGMPINLTKSVKEANVMLALVNSTKVKGIANNTPKSISYAKRLKIPVFYLKSLKQQTLLDSLNLILESTQVCKYNQN